MVERKRLTAYKAGLTELASGQFVKKEGFQSSYVLTSLGRKLSRVRIMGLVVDKFISQDGNYATLTLDDGSETLRCKIFINTKLIEDITPGDLVDVIGKVREYQEEVYIAPEIVRKVNGNWETLRLLELKKTWKKQRELISKVQELQTQTSDVVELTALASKAGLNPDEVQGIAEAKELNLVKEEAKVEATSELRDKVLKLIESKDEGEGADYDILLKESGLAEEQLDAALTELLESGICYEPKAGKIKKL